MEIKLYGVRGSIPTPAINDFDTRMYGGNTTCLEVIADSGDEYILDAGSGIRVLGNELMKKEFGKGQGKAKVLLSHIHWDHIHGWPFFVPAYIPGNEFEIYGGRKSDEKLEEALKEQGICSITQAAFEKQQSKYVFPIRLNQMPSTIEFYDLDEGYTINNGLRVGYTELNHPDGVYSYKLEEKEKTFIYATDTEHDGEIKGEKFGSMDKKLIKWIKGADILYYDGQYAPEEYNPEQYGLKGMPKIGWGHSTYEKGVEIAIEANVKTLVLGHHDPAHDDNYLDNLEKRAQTYMKEKLRELGRVESEIEVILAKEGMSLSL